jgi:hypothetical protein
LAATTISAAFWLGAHLALGGGSALDGGAAGQGGVIEQVVLREGAEIGVFHRRHPALGGRIDLQQRRAGGLGDALLVAQDIGGGVAAAPAPEHRLGGVVELAQQLALPAVPDPGPHGADVGDGDDQQQAQALGVLDDAGEGGDGAGVGDVALLGEVAHHQVMLDQPGDQLDLGAVDAQAFAGAAGGTGPGLLLAAHPALAGVVQQHGQEQGLAILDQRHDRDGQGMILDQASGGHVADHAHGPQGVLVHRVRVVHVELHLGDDPAELRE